MLLRCLLTVIKVNIAHTNYQKKTKKAMKANKALAEALRRSLMCACIAGHTFYFLLIFSLKCLLYGLVLFPCITAQVFSLSFNIYCRVQRKENTATTKYFLNTAVTIKTEYRNMNTSSWRRRTKKTSFYGTYIFVRPWQSQGLFYRHTRYSLINWFSDPFPPRTL